jgi:hypothetical protein
MQEFKDIAPFNPEIDEEVARRASMKVCALANDADDARELMLMLGLTSPKAPEPEQTPSATQVPPQSSKEFCNNGHPRTPENTVIKGNGVRRCLPCHKASNIKHGAKRKKQGGRKRRLTHCVNDHPWKPETVEMTADGRRKCLVCLGSRVDS